MSSRALASIAGAVLVTWLAHSCVAAARKADTQSARARQAVERTLPLLQSSARTWFQKRSCASCHHQGLGMTAVALARERGFKIDETMLAEQVAETAGDLAAPERYVIGDPSINEQIGQSYRLIGLASAGLRPRRDTALVVHMLLGKQHVLGHWNSYSRRPPLEDSEVTATAVTIRALRLFAIPNRTAEIDDRIRRARAWLVQLIPRSTEELTMQLLGLAWGKADANGITHVKDELLRQQRNNGGWAQIATRDSDAYATGQALVALNQAGGLPVEHPAFVRGIEFLLNTQKSDGSWLVETRRTLAPGLEYFETGFPHGKHQFISYAATAWATMALALSAKNGMSDVFMGVPPDAVVTAEDAAEAPALIRATLDGSLQELRTLLKQNPDVNAPWTEAGITPLMCVVRDPAKLELLLSAGARVNATAKAGESALILAAGYDGAAESVRLLLDRDADVNARSTSRRVGSALQAAALRGDRGVMSMLLDRGATVNDLPTGSSALLRAVFQGDVATATFLLDRGAQVASSWGTPPLGVPALIAAIDDGYPDVVKLLLERGAAVNAANAGGLTPLMYAAATDDRGDTVILEMLLAAGADVRARTHAGETALALAEKYGKKRAADILREAERRARQMKQLR